MPYGCITSPNYDLFCKLLEKNFGIDHCLIGTTFDNDSDKFVFQYLVPKNSKTMDTQLLRFLTPFNYTRTQLPSFLEQLCYSISLDKKQLGNIILNLRDASLSPRLS